MRVNDGFGMLVRRLLTFIKAPISGERHTLSMVFMVELRSMTGRQPGKVIFVSLLGLGVRECAPFFFVVIFVL